jgi:hypothetical protein
LPFSWQQLSQVFLTRQDTLSRTICLSFIEFHGRRAADADSGTVVLRLSLG